MGSERMFSEDICCCVMVLVGVAIKMLGVVTEITRG
jgi:hypothetical protein